LFRRGENQKFLPLFFNSEAMQLSERLLQEKTELVTKRETVEGDEMSIQVIEAYTNYVMEHFHELFIDTEGNLIDTSLFNVIFEKQPTYYEIENGILQLSYLFKLNKEYAK